MALAGGGRASSEHAMGLAEAQSPGGTEKLLAQRTQQQKTREWRQTESMQEGSRTHGVQRAQLQKEQRRRYHCLLAATLLLLLMLLVEQ